MTTAHRGPHEVPPLMANRATQHGLKPITECQWFLLCRNPATTTRPHTVLGDVPICARCDEKMTRIEQS